MMTGNEGKTNNRNHTEMQEQEYKKWIEHLPEWRCPREKTQEICNTMSPNIEVQLHRKEDDDGGTGKLCSPGIYDFCFVWIHFICCLKKC